MNNNTENQTIRPLQEIRTEMRESFKEVNTKIDGNTLILNMMMGYIHDHEQRITTLEDTVK